VNVALPSRSPPVYGYGTITPKLVIPKRSPSVKSAGTPAPPPSRGYELKETPEKDSTAPPGIPTLYSPLDGSIKEKFLVATPPLDKLETFTAPVPDNTTLGPTSCNVKNNPWIVGVDEGVGVFVGVSVGVDVIV
jgi:hypothetical protein